MDTYTAIWSKIVDSSIWDEPDDVVKVYMTMLAKKDRDHVVRASAYAIGLWARKTEKEVLEALKVLSEPDKRRLEPQPFEGRRIEKVEDGWMILNGAKYQEMMKAANRREYQRRKQAEYREKMKSGDGKENQQVRQWEEGHRSTEQLGQLDTEITNDGQG